MKNLPVRFAGNSKIRSLASQFDTHVRAQNVKNTDIAILPDDKIPANESILITSCVSPQDIKDMRELLADTFIISVQTNPSADYAQNSKNQIEILMAAQIAAWHCMIMNKACLYYGKN